MSVLIKDDLTDESIIGESISVKSIRLNHPDGTSDWLNDEPVVLNFQNAENLKEYIKKQQERLIKIAY